MNEHNEWRKFCEAEVVFQLVYTADSSHIGGGVSESALFFLYIRLVSTQGKIGTILTK